MNGAVSTLTVNVQLSKAVAAADPTAVGLASFNSANFSVDADGFVSSINNGNVVGPASSVNNNLVVFNGVTGKIVKDTGISSIAPTFTGNVTSLTRIIAPYDNQTGTPEGFYFSDGTAACRQIGTALANYFFGNAGNSTLSGIANTGVGHTALSSLTGGLENTAVGANCLRSATSANFNCGCGYFSLASLTSGVNNTAIGYGANGNNLVGVNNTSVGFLALQNNTGDFNCAIGSNSLQNSNAASSNTALGHATASSLLTGTKCLFLGTNSGSQYTGAESNNILIDSVGVTGESDVTRIGTTQTKFFAAGISGATVTGTAVLCAADGQLGTIVSSERYKENIRDIPEDVSVLSLRPVEFNYKGFRKISYGLIAEEVDRDFPYLCFYKEGKPESVKYQELCVFLLAEVQRLDARLRDLEQIGA